MITKINNVLNSLRKKLYLRLNALRFNFSIRRKGHLFEITVPKKYRSFARIIRISLIIISLVSAFFYFQSVWYAFLFGLAVFLLLEVLNRVFFSYTSMFVHTLPTFQIDSRKWTACFFGYATHRSMRGHIPVVGWQLFDETYLKRVHALLLEWSYGQLNDEKNSICTSVILMEDNSYIFYCYPNIERKTAVEFFGDVEKQRNNKTKSDVHHKIHTMQVIGKRFPISDKSYLPTFIQEYREGAPFLFRLAIQDQSGKSVPVENVDDFILRSLKIKKRKELTRMDSEYDLVRVLGRWTT